MDLWTTQARCPQLHRHPTSTKDGHIIRYKARTSVRATDRSVRFRRLLIASAACHSCEWMLVAEQGLGQLPATNSRSICNAARVPTGCIDDDIWRALHPDDRKSGFEGVPSR